MKRSTWHLIAEWLVLGSCIGLIALAVITVAIVGIFGG